MSDGRIFKTDDDVKKWVDAICGIELERLRKIIRDDKKKESEEIGNE